MRQEVAVSVPSRILLMSGEFSAAQALRHPVRFKFLDGLRALGALGVASLHIHVYGPLHDPAMSVLPDWVQTALAHGWMGVQVFFVISGFVIAHSLRNVRLTPAKGAEFLARRYLRLSPPYWVTIAVVTLLMFLPFHWHHDDSMAERPTGIELLLHLVYLQDVFGKQNISTGFWMLCIEMQFYIFYALLLGLAQTVTFRGGAGEGKQEGGGVKPAGWLWFFWAPGIVLLFFYHPAPHVEEWINAVDFTLDAWAPYFFGVIAFGIITYAALENWVPKWMFWSYAAVMLQRFAVEWYFYDLIGKEIAVGLLAGVSIYLAGRLGQMDRWLNVWPLQYLGRISYSFFLIHYAVSFVVKTLGYNLTAGNPWAAVGWMALSFAASIGAAHVLYVFVEEPAARLSKRIGERRSLGPASAPQSAPQS